MNRTLAAEDLTRAELAAMIDHTLIDADVTQRQMMRHCREALEHGFATVAVSPASVARCVAELAGSSVGVCAAVAFPLGQATTATKVFEASEALEQGASEVDVVVNIGAVKDGNMCYVASEIGEVVRACAGHVVKVILETCYLTDLEKKALLEISIEAGAAFVKTSTGRGPRGATMPDVLLLRSLAQERIKIKAAGGIQTLDQVLGYVDAGCERIGTSRAVAIMDEAAEVLSA